MSTMSWRMIVITILGTTLLFQPGETRIALDGRTVKLYADTLGQQLSESCSSFSGFDFLQRLYNDGARNSKLELIDGVKLAKETSLKIGSYLDIRLEAVKEIKKAAQKLFLEYNDPSPILSPDEPDIDSNDTFSIEQVRSIEELCERENTIYYNSKIIRVVQPGEPTGSDIDPELLLNPVAANESIHRYYPRPVSLENSTVHVPTNIYECAPTILGNISWTQGLDSIFKQNHKNMPSSWQFFASMLGFMRFYPGAHWPNDNSDPEHMDMYDARMTEWYTQGASLPKSIVILLDTSGSMGGLRLEIAKTTVKRILETLQENDYFNIIAFNNDSKFIDPCELSNGTLIQATAKNKRRLIDALIDQPTSEIADFDKAFTLAFEVLKEANATGLTGEESNNAIMLITDGAPVGFDDVFKNYNWSPDPDDPTGEKLLKWLRVFSYLIGNEVTDSNKEQVQWMACANKGYFYHIATMADVHEYVQDYVSIMARPLVIRNASYYSWSGVHLNLPPDGEVFSISVSMPVYNTNPNETAKGKLLGVAGADIMLDEIIRLIPKHRLGVNGYAFITNNNGFVVIHPDYTPWNNPELVAGRPKPDFQNVDITYLEQEVKPLGKISELRDRMIKGEAGKITAHVKRFLNKQKQRSYEVTQTYHFEPIKGTPYSLALVFAEEQVTLVTPKNWEVRSTKTDGLQALNACRLDIADWSLCNVDHRMLHNERPVDLLREMLANSSEYEKRCDDKAVSSLLNDALIIEGMPAEWLAIKQQSEPQESEDCPVPITYECAKLKKLAINFLAVGTRSGLTRFQEYNQGPINDTNQMCSSRMIHIDTMITSVEADYFKRASLSPKDIWTFEVPHMTVQRPFLHLGIPVTASRAVYIDVGGKDLMAAALAVNIDYMSLSTMLLYLTNFCVAGYECNQTRCGQDDVNCYLLDDNGFVIVADDPSEVGLPFTAIDYQVMTDMTEQDVYRTIHMLDFEALCIVCNHDTSSVASRLLDPFRYLYRSLWWLITQIALFTIQFSFYDWWNCIYYASGQETQYPDSGYDLDRFDRASDLEEMFSQASCKKDYTFYQSTRLPNASNDVSKCTTCIEGHRSYAVTQVPNTNLYLLMVEGKCKCDNSQKREQCIEPQEVFGGCSEEAMNKSRKPPDTHIEDQPPKVLPRNRSNQKPKKIPREDDSECGSCSELRPSILLCVIIQLLIFCIR